MQPQVPPPRRVAILAYRGNPDAPVQAEAMEQFLRQAGLSQIERGLFHDDGLEERVRQGEFDMLIALGGDGTVLRAGHLCAEAGVPILGINLGHFGFLTEAQRGDWHTALQALAAGNYRVEERLALCAEHQRAGQVLSQSFVVNDVVIARGQAVRPIRVNASVDGYVLTTYVSDGVIASTPTGSTAYALAAGGPIMPPELRNILLIPVAAHLTMDRAIILSEGASVQLTAYTEHEAVMSVDGRAPTMLLDGDTVRVSASDRPVRFVRIQDPGYFYRKINAYMEQNPSARIRS
jgi:NAD+ kinase